MTSTVLNEKAQTVEITDDKGTKTILNVTVKPGEHIIVADKNYPLPLWRDSLKPLDDVFLVPVREKKE